jgi:hypothetical protein
MDILSDPEVSRKAALAVQRMPIELRETFLRYLQEAERIEDLPAEYRNYYKNGYKPDKVLPPLEKALMDVIIEWND